MKTSTLVIIIIVISLSVFTWLISIWQYDAMMSSMMTFSNSPAVLSLFVVIWTAGMAAMMFPAMILVYNRLIDNTGSNSNTCSSNSNSQKLYHKTNSAFNDIDKQHTRNG